MMIDEIINRNREIIRRSMDKVAAEKIEIQNEAVTDALDYFERQTDITLVREKLKERGAVGVRKTEGEHGYETYTKQRTAEMIDNGEYEVMTSGIGRRICNARAQLFTNPLQRFNFLNNEGVSDKEASIILDAHRAAGSFGQSLADADYVACAVDSGPLLVDWKAEHLNYTPLNPANVYFKFHDSLTDNGNLRGVDYTDLDDCSVMVIKLAGTPSDVLKNNYLAIFGRSEQYPLGRHVYYTAQRWDDWPLVGTPGATDWEYKGQIANPLSVYAQQTGSSTEYPLVIIKGGVTITTASTPHPTTTSLYELSREIDVAFSRVLKDGLSSALGLKVVQKRVGETLPRCLEGVVAIHDGESVQLLDLPIANAQGALAITTEEARSMAEGYGCPAYLVLREATAPESGVALAIRTKPLADELERRAKINTNQVARLFEIEKGLYNIYTGGELVPSNVTQSWQPGRYVYPESDGERVTRLSDAQSKGLISYVRAVRDYHLLASDEEAIELIDKMKEQDAEYKASSTEPQSPMQSLLGRLPSRQGKQSTSNEGDGIDWNNQPYATMTDSQLGKRLGVSGSKVSFERNKRGIKPYKGN